MIDFYTPRYDKPRNWINNARDYDVPWDKIFLANKKNKEELKGFLDTRTEEDFWPELTVDDWKIIVEQQKTAEETAKNIDILAGIAQIHDEGQNNATRVPEDPASSWQLYKKKLLNDGFKEETVDEIERTTLKILRRLNNDTSSADPVKGMVIGNVQSGKTANMAALMAMAADWGWNMFIVLSGTIENLRIQTQNRLFSDLNQQGTIWWRSLEHLSKNVDISMKAQNLHFDANSKERYFTVCLKNSARLKKLIQWAQADPNKQRQMKVLVIDDEADQASVNTAKIDVAEKKKINKLICALVNGLDENENETESHFQAMNYIGYTATPYANILNDSSKESLYPRSFITTLAVSKEYFGPQQIFGYDGDSVNFDGMNIVRTIDDEELDEIKSIHSGEAFNAPESLVDAICWFICGVSCMRIWGYRKPVSMLVHTSQKTDHHKHIADVINNWLMCTPKDDIIQKAKEVFARETALFNKASFRQQYPEYDIPDDQINDYPDFEQIEKQIRIILHDEVSHIELDSEGDLSYHKGIHLCIDNCTNNGINSDGMHVRLAYPESEKMPSPAPAFIVVGGSTLSRGLTIEGLISTFFLRSVGQADTLMQMGRWFGYRKKYELLPRLWLTEKTKQQFIFLAALDQELRDEIQYMDINGKSPSEYGPKVKNTPKLSFIRITAKNKMQSAIDSTMDYSGASNQTYLFDNDAEVLRNNIDVTEGFIAGLGDEWVRNDEYNYYSDTAVWRNVPFDKVRTYLESYSFQERQGVFNNVQPLLNWISKMTSENKLENWNIVVAGKKDNRNGTWILPNGREINKVRRTRKRLKTEVDTIINIGALREPRDVLADIDINAIKDFRVKREVESFVTGTTSRGVMAYRDKSGLETTPQLIIYRIDKDSKANSKTREDLNAVEDIVGLCIYIPGGRIGTNYVSTISINLKNDVFDGDADLEGTNEN